MSLPDTAILSARQTLIRRAMAASDLDAFVVTAPANIRYLSNHTGTAGVLVMTTAAAYLLVDFRYETAVAALQASPAAAPGLCVRPVPASYDDALLGCLIEMGARRVGIEGAHLTVARHEWLLAQAAARGADLVFRTTARVVEQGRLVKDASEVALLRESARRLGPVADGAVASVRAGLSERTVAGVIEGALRSAGYERAAFDTIVASGPNAALPHHRAGDRLLAPGDLVVLDFGGVLDGYCSDLTRTVSIGAPSPQARQVYDAVHDAQQAAIGAVRPGIDAASVDGAARAVLDARGFGAAFGHGTGHGLGLDVHEEPRIGRLRPDGPPVILEPGMVFTIEPGVYLPGWGGVRIEDDVLVTSAGCDVLTSAPRALVAR
jgi:Xaa-Pro aminopeptidase